MVSLTAFLVPLTLLRWPAARLSADLPANRPAFGVTPARLVREAQDVYLLTGRTRRWVSSLDVFADYRFRWEWVQQITESELTSIPRGPDLIAGPVLVSPQGELWVVLDGRRRAVVGSDAWSPLSLSPVDAYTATGQQIDSYPQGRPVGNPSRRWLGAIVMSLATAAALMLWLQPGWTALSALLAVSTAAKLAFALLYPWVPDGADAPLYTHVATFLLEGHSLFQRDPSDLHAISTSPLYPLILVALGPVHALAGAVGWKVVQVFAAAALPPLTASVAGELFDARAAKAAFIVSALTPVWFYSAELIQYELWLATVLIGATAASLRAVRTSSRGRSLAWAIVAGLLYGVGITLQLKAGALAALAAVVVAWRSQSPRRRPDVAARLVARVRDIALVLVVATLPVGLWAARNVVVYGEPVFGAISAGVVFWMGNHPAATGGIMQVPRPDAWYARRERYPAGSITGESRAYADLAWEFISHQPTRAALLALSKLERFWWTITPDRLGEHAELRTEAFLGGFLDAPAIALGSKMLNVGSLILAGTGALSALHFGASPTETAGDGRRAARLLVLGSIALLCVVHAPFISEPRYRLPALPFIHVLEGGGLAVMVQRVRRRSPIPSPHGAAA